MVNRNQKRGLRRALGTTGCPLSALLLFEARRRTRLTDSERKFALAYLHRLAR